MTGRKKVIKIAGISVLALLAVVVVATAAFYLDLAGHLATGSQAYEPDGVTTGKAIIVYNPGWTGLTWKAVDALAALLAGRGYEVDVAGVSNGLAQDVSGYDLVIVGSPNYGERPTDRIGAFIENMHPRDGATIGVLCTSAGDTPKGADAMKARIQGRGITVKAMMTLAMSEPVEPACPDFVEALLNK